MTINWNSLRSASLILTAVVLLACEGSVEKGGEDSEFKIRNIDINSAVGSLLKEDAVKIGAAGGSFTVEYDIDGPQVGNVADVSCDASFVSVGKVYSTGFTVTLAGNDSGADRSAKLLLSRPGVKPKTIVILQTKESTAEEIFHNYRIEVKDVTSFSAKFKVTPKDASKTYHYSVVSKADYEYVGKDRYLKEIISNVKAMAGVTGSHPNKLLFTNIFEDFQTTYRDDTDYYVVVFDLCFDEKGHETYSGEVDLKLFHTLKTKPADTKFTLSMSGNRLVVSPSDNMPYICDVMSEEAWNEFSEPRDAAWIYIQTIIKQTGSLNGYVYAGSQSLDMSANLSEKGKSYVAYAVGYRNDENDKGLSTEVQFIKFIY